MILYQKKTIAVAMDFSGSNDLYIFTLRPDISQWTQVYKKTSAEFTKTKLSSHFNTITLIAFNGSSSEYSFVSYDRAESWSELSLPFTPYCFYPLTDQIIYAASEDTLMKSENGGTDWTTLGSFGPGTGTPIEIYIYTNTDGSTHILVIHDEGSVFHSYNGGSSWSETATGLPSIEQCVRKKETIILFSNNQCILSHDRGLTWSTPIHVSDYSIQDAISIENNIIAAAANDRLCISNDTGNSWEEEFPTDGEIIHSITYDENFKILGCNETYGTFFIFDNLGASYTVQAFNEDPDIRPRSLKQIPEERGVKAASKINREISSKSHITKTIITTSTIDKG